MGIFGKRGQSDATAHKKTPIGPIDDAQLERASQLMAAFNRAVGDDAALRAVSAEIYAAAGVGR